MKQKTKKNKNLNQTRPAVGGGQAIIELLIALLIFAFIFLMLASSLGNLLTSRARSKDRLRAVHYAQEAMEVAYNIIVNTESWEGFVNPYANGDIYHPRITAGDIGLDHDEELLDNKFRRQVIIEKAKRDDAGNLSADGSHTDSNTLKVLIKIIWKQGSQDEQINYVSYLINLMD